VNCENCELRTQSYTPAVTWIDGHLDLAYLGVNGRDLRVRCADPGAGCVSLPELREAGVEMAFATIFTEVAGTGEPGTCSPHDAPHVYRDVDDLDGAHAAGMRQLELYEQLERENCVHIVRSRADLEGDADGPLRILILMEGADPIRSPSELGEWFERGVRMIGLTWAMASRYAGGNASPGPLTAKGLEMVDAMDELGVIHDVSHLADEAFEQLACSVRGPVVASHSNARALATPSQRHLRDDQIEWIGSRGGVIGVNLFRKFLSPTKDGTLHDVVRHAQHMTALTGRSDAIALGSDMDGGFLPSDLASGLEHPTKLRALAEALRAIGWSDEQVRGMQRENWLKFLRRALA
jgi:membrane dipeptidase